MKYFQSNIENIWCLLGGKEPTQQYLFNILKPQLHKKVEIKSVNRLNTKLFKTCYWNLLRKVHEHFKHPQK
jgi:hypothetical protein